MQHVNVDKQEVFTDYVWSFMMPDHDYWKKEIENIVLIEKNKSLHNFSTENLEDKPVQAHKTAWDSHLKWYHSTAEIKSVNLILYSKNNFFSHSTIHKTRWLGGSRFKTFRGLDKLV